MPSPHINRNPLFSRVKNNSGVERVFGYLGTHGLRLAVGEVYTLRGNLIDKLGNQLSARQFKALERDIQSGALVIEQTPPPLLLDPITGATKALTLVNGTLGTIAPDWDTSDMSNFDG